MNSERRWNKAVRVCALALAAALLLAGCSADNETGSSTEMLSKEHEAEAGTTAGAGAESTGAPESEARVETAGSQAAETKVQAAPETKIGTDTEPETEEPEMTLQMTIGDTAVNVKWEKNESAEALKALCKDGPLTIQMSMYGGFEQVGRIGQSLPRADVQTTTQAGDIVLYSGNQLVVFYGSNSWAYTRLGRITDKSAKETAELLGNGNVTVTLELK